MDNQKLIELAKDARKLSYSPYSRFAVGAALETRSGRVYLGANIENASYPLCMCGERNAIYNALMNGEKGEDILRLAIVADSKEVCSPCGACRQVISELMDQEADIILGNLDGKIRICKVKDLIPFAFSGKDLGVK